MADSPLLHRPAQAAARLNVGRTKVFELIKSGDLDSVRVGRIRLIPESACRAYVRRLLDQQAGSEAA
jgi:excisionase family DNA binding protein